MQAILDLQERIRLQLNSSSDNLSALATPSTMVQLNNRHGSISRSLCPPCYCTAGAPELLLDIIGQTTHVKMYEHTIQVVELPQATQNSSLTHTAVTPDLTSRSSPTAVNQKRKRPSKDDPPPSLFTLPTPTPTPITHNQTNVSNVLMAPSPNYCLALNSLPVMLVNSTMSLVQPIPALPLLGSGLPSNQVLCYMTPEQFVKPLNPTPRDRTTHLNNTEQQTRGSESTLVTSLHTPLSLSPPSRAESAIDPSPVKIERVRNEAVSHIVSSRKRDVPEAVAMTGEIDCSDECEETSLAPHSTLASKPFYCHCVCVCAHLLSVWWRARVFTT